MIKHWQPDPELFAGKTVAILAGGPSLTMDAVDAVSHLPRIVINNSYQLAPDADMLVAADYAWWKVHKNAWKFAGIKVCMQSSINTDEIYYLRPLWRKGKGNSALHAACIAQACGASRALLLGVDLRDDELTHWHGQHEGEGLRNPSCEAFKVMRRSWGLWAEDATIDVVNCSERSALKCFPIKPLREALLDERNQNQPWVWQKEAQGLGERRQG